jgi:hypothetical protein
MANKDPFLKDIAVRGGDRLVANYRAMTQELRDKAVTETAESVLNRLASEMRTAVTSLETRTDSPMVSRKVKGGRWWPYKDAPGTVRNKIASAVTVMPLGSQQQKYFVGRRLGIAGKSGSFYGRLLERGHRLTRFFGFRPKKEKTIPGRWMFLRTFNRLKPAIQGEAFSEFQEFITRWNPPPSSKDGS